MFYDILERENAFLGYKLFVKNSHFFQLFLLGKIRQVNAFHDIQDRKNAFLGHKKNLKKCKNWQFSKGVTPWLGQKLAFFPAFSFRQIRSRKCGSRYSKKEKTAFLGLKKKVETVKKLEFFQRG